MFVGAMTALVTPMRDGQVDEAALEALVEWQIAEGIDALVPCGTTGESATLTHDEHGKVVRARRARRRRSACRSSPAPDRTRPPRRSRCRRTRAKPAPTRSCRSRPTTIGPRRKGSYLHFRAIAEAVPLPHRALQRAGAHRLRPVARDDRAPVRAAVGGRRSRKRTARCSARSRSWRASAIGWCILSGEDAINYPLYAVGARGCISVVSNVAPRLVADCWDAHAAGDAAARAQAALRRRCRWPRRSSPRRARSRRRRRWR